MGEKIKTGLRFPAKENPNMEKALFDLPIVLQYEVKAKHRLVSRKFSGMKFFHPSVRLTNQKVTRAFLSIRYTHQIALFPFVCCFCFVRAFSFQGHTKIVLTHLLPAVLTVTYIFTVRKIRLARLTFQENLLIEQEKSVRCPH